MNWNDIVPDVDEVTLDFIKSFIKYNHKERLSAKEVGLSKEKKKSEKLFLQALCHNYFFTPPEVCPIETMPKPGDLKSCVPNVEDFDRIISDFDEVML